MTIIAYRDGILAADTLISCRGSRAASALKIRRQSGWLAGGAGSPSILTPVMRWIADGANLWTPINLDKIGDAGALLISPRGEVYSVDTESPYPVEEQAEWFAIGSGSDAALAAMLLDCSAVEAVNIAKKIDQQCGGGTVWLNLADPAQDSLELPKEIYNSGN